MFILDCTPPEIGPVVGIVKQIVTIIYIAIPIILILLGVLDMAKAVMAGDEKEIQGAQKIFIKRLIYAGVAFLIPLIVMFLMNFISKYTKNGTSWYDCWKSPNKSVDV